LNASLPAGRQGEDELLSFSPFTMKVHISLLNHDPQEVEFNELLKKNERIIIYFYPKDDTPGCTIEAKDFSNEYATFLKHGI
jgi:peroxiredoxin